jgi:acyl-CoA thioester hydrolase
VTSYTYTFTVSPDVIDFNGHVGNVTYLEWMIEAATRHSRSLGLDYEQCKELGGTWVAKSHTIEYKKPALEGDVLRMRTWIDQIGNLSAIRRYELHNIAGDFLVCYGQTEWVFVDAKRMRPKQIPAPLRALFSK